MLPAYAELHCLSNFSFLRGASHPEELVERAQALGYAALAITDECSVAGVVRAHLAAKDAGLPLVIGSEFTLVDGTEARAATPPTARPTATSRSSSRAAGAMRPRARYALTRDDVAALAPRCLALWMPPDPLVDGRRRRERVDAARWVADVFAGRAWIAVELFARAGDRARLARLRSARARDAACRSSPPATCTCTCARAARCRTR